MKANPTVKYNIEDVGGELQTAVHKQFERMMKASDEDYDYDFAATQVYQTIRAIRTILTALCTAVAFSIKRRRLNFIQSTRKRSQNQTKNCLIKS